MSQIVTLTTGTQYALRFYYDVLSVDGLCELYAIVNDQLVWEFQFSQSTAGYQPTSTLFVADNDIVPLRFYYSCDLGDSSVLYIDDISITEDEVSSPAAASSSTAAYSSTAATSLTAATSTTVAASTTSIASSTSSSSPTATAIVMNGDFEDPGPAGDHVFPWELSGAAYIGSTDDGITPYSGDWAA